MKALSFMFLVVAAAVPPCVWAQTTAPAPPSSDALDPAKVAEYQKRFQQGYDLEQQGQLKEAREIYDGILTEQPDAKRSLLEAGRISLELNEPLKADGYLDKLHALVPDFPTALELLIQSNQALKRDVKVERLVREYRKLWESGKVPKPYFDREHLQLDQDHDIVFSQFFDYTQPPYYAIQAEMTDAQGNKRALILTYDPDGTQALRAKNPQMAHDEVFLLAEPTYTGDKMTKIDVYQMLPTADYNKTRIKMLGIFMQTPKPIYSTPVNAGQ